MYRHAPACGHCSARLPATAKSVYLAVRKVGLAEFVVIIFFPFLLPQR